MIRNVKIIKKGFRDERINGQVGAGGRGRSVMREYKMMKSSLIRDSEMRESGMIERNRNNGIRLS